MIRVVFRQARNVQPSIVVEKEAHGLKSRIHLKRGRWQGIFHWLLEVWRLIGSDSCPCHCHRLRLARMGCGATCVWGIGARPSRLRLLRNRLAFISKQEWKLISVPGTGSIGLSAPGTSRSSLIALHSEISNGRLGEVSAVVNIPWPFARGMHRSLRLASHSTPSRAAKFGRLLTEFGYRRYKSCFWPLRKVSTGGGGWGIRQPLPRKHLHLSSNNASHQMRIIIDGDFCWESQQWVSFGKMSKVCQDFSGAQPESAKWSPAIEPAKRRFSVCKIGNFSPQSFKNCNFCTTKSWVQTWIISTMFSRKQEKK